MGRVGLATCGRLGPQFISLARLVIDLEIEKGELEIYTGETRFREKGRIIRQHQSARPDVKLAYNRVHMPKILHGSIYSLRFPSIGIETTSRHYLQHRDHLIVHCLRVQQGVPALLVVDSGDAVPDGIKSLVHDKYIWKLEPDTI